MGRFVPWDVLSLGRFVLWDVLSLGPYICMYVLGRFFLGRFICAPKYILSMTLFMKIYLTLIYTVSLRAKNRHCYNWHEETETNKSTT